MRVHHQPAYVILNRPYSETSWIVEIFSRDFGRMALMAKGARRLKSKLKGVLLPFQPLLLSWTGKGEVPTLTAAEIDQSEFDLVAHELRGEALVCGFYCNELVVNLLHRYDPHRQLYSDYHSCILHLNHESKQQHLATELRVFERSLLRETGYEVSFEYEADGRTSIENTGRYRFQAGQGFVRVNTEHGQAVSGRIIRAMVQEPSAVNQEPSAMNQEPSAVNLEPSAVNLEPSALYKEPSVAHREPLASQHPAATDEHSAAMSPEELSQGKYLMRDILNQTLGHKKIVSRELFFPKIRS